MNLHHAKLAQDCLVKDMLSMNSNTKGSIIVLIQEPYLGSRGHPVGLVRPTDCLVGDKSARAAVVGLGADLRLCPDLSDRDTTTCQMVDGSKVIHLVSSYWDCKLPLPKVLDKVMDKVGDNNIIIGMDSNAHSTLWGCDDSDSRGIALEEFIFNRNLVVLNRGKADTFVTPRASSIIDVTLCSRNMINHLDGGYQILFL